MEFHSEWLLENPIEVFSEVNKAVLSPDDLDKLSTKENLTDFEKSVFLLETGQISQKLWVVSNLHLIMREPRFPEIIAELINRLPYWNEKAQLEVGKSFTNVIRKHCFPTKYSDHLIDLSFQIIDSDTWPLQETWCQVLGNLFKILTEKQLARCLKELISLTNYNQSEKSRSAGGLLLRFIIKSNQKPNQEILRKIFSLAQDPSNFVRKQMAGPLKALFKSCPETRNRVLEEIIKLLSDDCEEVLEEALKLVTQIFPDIENKNKLIEVFEEIFVCGNWDKMTEVKLKHCGKIMTVFSKDLSENCKEKWVDWVVRMITEGGEKESVAVSGCIGAILQSGVNEKTIQLWNHLQSEENLEVQQNLAIQLACFCVYSKELNKELPENVEYFLQKPEFSSILIPQMIVIAGTLKSFEEPLQYLLQKYRENLKTRDKTELVRQLILFSNKYPCITHLRPLFYDLISSVKSATEPVKEKIVELIAAISYKSAGFSVKNSYFKEVINTLAYSPCCYLRSAFIQFCVQIKDLCSKKLFNRFFMSPLLALSKDKIFSVKLSFISNFACFRFLVPQENQDLASKFKLILTNYLEQDNKELIKLALKADDQLEDQRAYQEAYGPAALEIEKTRFKLECEEEFKEIQVIENNKKKEAEVITKSNKVVLKKRTEIKEPALRQNSVKPTKRYIVEVKANLNRSGLRNLRKK